MYHGSSPSEVDEWALLWSIKLLLKLLEGETQDVYTQKLRRNL